MFLLCSDPSFAKDTSPTSQKTLIWPSCSSPPNAPVYISFVSYHCACVSYRTEDNIIMSSDLGHVESTKLTRQQEKNLSHIKGGLHFSPSLPACLTGVLKHSTISLKASSEPKSWGTLLNHSFLKARPEVLALGALLLLFSCFFCFFFFATLAQKIPLRIVMAEVYCSLRQEILKQQPVSLHTNSQARRSSERSTILNQIFVVFVDHVSHQTKEVSLPL